MLKRAIVKLLNTMKLHNKFLIMYVFCVIIPLIITDAVILYAALTQEYKDRMYEMDIIATRYQSTIQGVFDYDADIARAVNDNAGLNHFLDHDYMNPYDYYSAYYDFINDSFFKTLAGQTVDKVTVYSANPTIGDGMYFKKLSYAENQEWYQLFLETGRKESLIIYYDNTVDSRIESRRKIIYARRIEQYDSKYDKVVAIENNSTDMLDQIQQVASEYPMYICCDDYVVFSSDDNTLISVNVEALSHKYRMGSHRSFITHAKKIDIYIYSDELLLTSVIKSKLLLIIIMIVVTLMLPIIIMNIIEQTITTRVQKLGKAFSGNKENKFLPIRNIDGNDEISDLMTNYNNIVAINNELINTLYKDKLREQEIDIARKNAELLALQSQINPHFMFNALESIRMHSILRGEDETAAMVEKLAVMERQNVEWGNDLVSVKKETESIAAYLYLQSYRFGDRLSFDIDIEPDCEQYLIPKLTLVTFVENACVHGIESKTSAGWIFVRVYKKEDYLCMEVEDTGGGMTDEELASMMESIENVSIDMIKGKKHVGILNACLRLKMHTENAVKISIDSEQGVGMCVLIRIPFDKLKNSN